ncbi:MAG: AAA family ATPase [Alphaproteobacteria bacterium]
MASDDSENGYHGYRYLTDATDSRQYAVRFDNGRPTKPFQVFALDPRESRFKPNETVFALDDDTEIKSVGGKTRISTTAYQVSINAAADPTGMKFVGVEYDVSFDFQPGDFRVKYTLTKESQAALADIGMDAGFPKTFSDKLSPTSRGLQKDAAGNILIDPSVLRNLSFPPHHDGGAIIARQNLEMTSTEPTVQPRVEDQSKPTEKPTVTTNPTTDKPTTVTKPFNTATTNIPKPPERPKISDASIEGVIRQYCDDLTEKAINGKLDPVVGRDQEVVDSIKILSRRKQASVCYTGDAGVGKTAMFSGVAQYIADDKDVPDSLRGARVLSLDLQAMNAGAKFRGQFEEKLKPLIDGLKEREGYLKGRKIILAIDEIHSQLTSGKAEGGTDAGNMMKPFLTSKGISVMGTTTSEEYRKHIEKDNAMASRFEQKVLAQPDADSTRVILNKLWPLIKEHHGIAEDLAQEDLEYVITMTNRYAPNESQPRKGEKALDMAAASAKFRHSNVIEREDIITAVAQMSRLKSDFLNQSDHDRFLKMETELPQQVLGQPGVQRVVDGLIGSRSGLNDPNQPWAAFVFQGPTGTGKTELCKALSRYLFGTEEALIQLNMGEYSEKHTVSRLIGAPPGYVGFDTAEPALTEKIRQRPYSILLLDEIEKAHPDVFNVLLPVLNDGKMTDNQGKTVLFNNVIVVMTTNLGAKEAMAALKGGANGSFDQGAAEMPPEQQEAILAKKYETARGQFFRPEMVNRIEELGGFVTFIPLAPSVIKNLVNREVDKINKRIADPTGANIKGITLEIGQEAHDQLAREGYKPEMGARPLRKVVREKVSNPLGKWVIANKAEIVEFVAKNGGAKIVIDTVGGAFAPRMEKAGAVVAAEAAATATNDNKAVKDDAGKPKVKKLKP